MVEKDELPPSREPTEEEKRTAGNLRYGPRVPESVRETFDDPKPGQRLTPREIDVGRLVAKGYSNKVVAGKLSITEGSVKVYLSRIFVKLRLNSRHDLACWVMEHNYSIHIRELESQVKILFQVAKRFATPEQVSEAVRSEVALRVMHPDDLTQEQSDRVLALLGEVVIP